MRPRRPFENAQRTRREDAYRAPASPVRRPASPTRHPASPTRHPGGNAAENRYPARPRTRRYSGSSDQRDIDIYEQGTPSPSRARGQSYAASLAGEGIPAWLTHKINSHPEAGVECWITPAAKVAGRRVAKPRESSKRRKAISAQGRTLIIPNISERQDTQGTRQRRKAAITCNQILETTTPMGAWRDVEVVIQAECQKPIKQHKRNRVTSARGAPAGEGSLPPHSQQTTEEGKGEGSLLPQSKRTMSRAGGGDSPLGTNRAQKRSAEGGTPPPPEKRVTRQSGREGKTPTLMRGAGPQPGEG